MPSGYLLMLIIPAGLASGFMITEAADKIARCKYRIKGGELEEDRRFTCAPLRAALAAVNGAAWAFTGCTLKNPFAVLLVSLLITDAIAIALIDLRIRTIPNELVLAMLAAGAGFQLVYFGVQGFVSALACMVVLALVFSLVAAIAGLDKIGAGDIKLIGAMGMALGYPYITTALAAMSITIIFYCVFGIVSQKLRKTSMFPYAPFIMLGMASSIAQILMNSGNR